MKRLFSVILAIAAALSLSINVFAEGSVSLSAPTEVEKGESFEVKISIADNPGICSVKIKVRYDPDTFKYESYTEGKLFPMLMSSKSSGAVTISADSAGDIYKSGTYATLKFTAIGDPGANGNIIVEVTSAKDSVGRTVTLDGSTFPVSIAGPVVTAPPEDVDVVLDDPIVTEATTKATKASTK